MPFPLARLGAAALLIATTTVVAAPSKDTDAELRRLAEGFMRDHRIPGMAIAITVDGRERFYNFGVASKETGREVTSDTLFELGSISKTFLATLAAYAQEEGKLSLTGSVETYLPEFRGKPFGAVSLVNLGTHTAGGFPLQVPDEVTNQDQLVAWLKAWKPRYAAGTQRTYANPSIGMLGAIAARQLGAPYADAAEKTMFPKLGLTDTYVRVPAGKMDAYAQGYNNKDAPIRVGPGPLDAEAYGVKSTAKDLLHYVEVQLGEAPVEPAMRHAIAATHVGYYRSGPMTQDLAWEHYPWPVSKTDLLTGNASRMIREDQPATALNPPQPATNDSVINKTGATNGFGAYVAFVPARKLGLVILANHNHPTEARVGFAYEVLRLFAPELSRR
ncbi:class C beta-lactamase [Dyella sp. BiH032]|uniref:class C beta-lactamase n=1 Tax=Dyella sp. BiH032 TaxID=3075430 RepID=UPI00289323C5|nr:class C beta-lactamase [Dyella sp. BiH032]WNL44465.1 class C beta-lactamase [Dyella sp. BiH032]